MELKDVTTLLAITVAGVSAFYAWQIAAQSDLNELTNRVNSLEQHPTNLPTQEIRGLIFESTEFVNLANSVESLSDSIPPSLPTGAAFPSGAVIAFAVVEPRNPDVDPCPDGWQRYERANGRFIVGAGTHSNNVSELTPFEMGGERARPINLESMPRHRHGIRLGEGSALAPGPVNYALASGGNESATAFEGGATPHNNMPPYIALFYCTNFR